MDALRTNVSRSETSVKAASFRFIKASSDATTSQQHLTATLAELKSNNVPETKQRANHAAQALKAANAALSEATEALETRKAEAESAKEAYNEHHATRPRRANNRDKFEYAMASRETSEASQAICPLSIAAFQSAAKANLANVANMSSFPEPPSQPCANPNCIKSKKDRALDACPCNIGATFSGLTFKALTAAKNSYHPSRFDKAPESIRSDSKAKAKEIYDVVNRMWMNTPTSGSGKGKKNNYQQASRTR